MGSRERNDPMFVDALKSAHPPLARLTLHEVTSWIVARLNYLVGGSIELIGNEFAHDTNEFGYKIRLADNANATLASTGNVTGSAVIN